MAQTIINNGDTGLVARNAINNNFTELYDYSIRLNVAAQINSISAKATPIGADILIIEDSADSWNKKKVLLSNMIATDGTAIHEDVAGEINAITVKAVPTSSDLLLIEDAADSNNKKKITLGTLPFDSSKIEDTDGDTYVDTESGSDTDIVEFGSPATGSTLGFKFISDTGGTPTEVLQVDGDGNLIKNGYEFAVLKSAENSFYLATDSLHSSAGGSADNNFGFGGGVMPSVSSGNNNIGIGRQALYTLTTGTYNTVFGRQAGYSITSGKHNVLIGPYAGYALTTGESNIFLGEFAGRRHTTESNVFQVSNQSYANLATEQSDALIYAVMNATKASQTLTINAATTISNDLTGNILTVDDGSTDVLTVDNDGNSIQTGYNSASGLIQGMSTITASTYNITASDHTLQLDGTSNAVTVTLPSIGTANHGQIYEFACINSSNTVTIDTISALQYIGYTGTSQSTTLSVGQFTRYQADNNSSRWIKLN